jgi:hypothetical protein
LYEAPNIKANEAFALRHLSVENGAVGQQRTSRDFSATSGLPPGGFNQSTQHLLLLPDEEVCVWRGMHGHGSRQLTLDLKEAKALLDELHG